MSALHIHRDDGPVARWVRPSLLPIPEVVLVATAVVMAGAASVAGSPRWVAVLIGVLVALTGRAARPSERLDWALPAMLRLLEYGAIVLLAGASPWAYALAATLAFRHYDIVYRQRIRGDHPARWLAVVTGGWELRTAVLAIAAALGSEELVAALLTLVLAPLVVAEASASWAGHRT